MGKYLRLLLLPFSVLYGLVVLLRNQLYDWKIFKSTKFDLPVICVGNLAVGGTGKTPVTEYLVKLLSDYKIAILSRGYGRKTKGYIVADCKATASAIGDEPMQFYSKFPEVTVAVCEDRVKGINQLKEDHDLIILDDAFQHRSVQPGYSILLFDFNKFRKWDYLLPAGNLRDTFSSRRRAQAFVITKCPETLSPAEKHFFANKLSAAQEQSLVFSYIRYNNLTQLFTKEIKQVHEQSGESQVFLITGIANTLPLLDELKKTFLNIIEHRYPDHHVFSKEDIIRLRDDFEKHPAKEKIIITTEKDAQRLVDNALQELLLNLPVYYLPIQIDFIEQDKTVFDHHILNYVKNATRIH